MLAPDLQMRKLCLQQGIPADTQLVTDELETVQGSIVSLQIHVHSEPQNMALFAAKTFADVISTVKIRTYWMGVGPKSKASPYKERQIGRTWSDTEELQEAHDPVVTQAETGVMRLQAKQCQGLRAT